MDAADPNIAAIRGLAQGLVGSAVFAAGPIRPAKPSLTTAH